MNNKKVYNPTDKELRAIFIQSINQSLKFLKEVKENRDPDDKSENSPIYSIFDQLEISKYKIRGFGWNVFAQLVHTLEQTEATEDEIEKQLQLIEDTLNTKNFTINIIIFCAASKPPDEKTIISDDLSIRSPSSGEIEYYMKIIDGFERINPEIQNLCILELKFSYDIQDEPRFMMYTGGNDYQGEILSTTMLPESNYHKELKKYFDIISYSSRLSRGEFIPVYRVESNNNPYIPGYTPIQYNRIDLYAKGVDFSDSQIVANFKELYIKFHRLLIVHNMKQVRMAINRLLGFYSPYRTNEDKLIDGVVMLEAILLPGIRDELSYRAAQRASALISADSEMKLYVFNLIKNAYGERSKLVHGASPEVNWKKVNFQDFFNICYLLFNQCLVIYDHDQYPADANINNFDEFFQFLDKYILLNENKDLKEYMGINLFDLIVTKNEQTGDQNPDSQNSAFSHRVYFGRPK